MTPKPNFFIVGAARSGTSSLYSYFSRHPDIFLARIKEPHYFSGLSQLIASREEYYALFATAGLAKAVGEASTSYLFVPGTAERIFEALGNVKIIASLRNPVDRAFSNWQLAKAHSKIETLTFEAALEAEEERYQRRHGLGYWPGLMYFRSGLYYHQVKAYMDVFGVDHVKVLIFEEFIKSPIDQFRSLFAFLEVDTNFIPQIKRRNASHIPAFQFFYNLVSPPNPALLWLYKNMPTRLKPYVYSMVSYLHRLNRRPNFADEKIPEKLRRKLYEEYRPDIESLSELLKVDLLHWWTG